MKKGKGISADISSDQDSSSCLDLLRLDKENDTKDKNKNYEEFVLICFDHVGFQWVRPSRHIITEHQTMDVLTKIVKGIGPFFTFSTMFFGQIMVASASLQKSRPTISGSETIVVSPEDTSNKSFYSSDSSSSKPEFLGGEKKGKILGSTFKTNFQFVKNMHLILCVWRQTRSISSPVIGPVLQRYDKTYGIYRPMYPLIKEAQRVSSSEFTKIFDLRAGAKFLLEESLPSFVIFGSIAVFSIVLPQILAKQPLGNDLLPDTKGQKWSRRTKILIGVAILISLILLGVVLIKFFPGSKVVPPVTVNLPPINEVNWQTRAAGKKRKNYGNYERKEYEKVIVQQFIPEILRYTEHLLKYPEDVLSINRLKKLVKMIEKHTSFESAKRISDIIKKYAPHVYNNSNFQKRNDSV